MDAAEQAKLVREFMLAIAPEVVKSQLTLTRRHMASTLLDEDQIALIQSRASAAVGRLTLEWAMHLAGCYAACYDEAVPPSTSQQEARSPKPSV
jgi:hypothetical protein